jgi:hypothetical protein
MGQSPLRVLFFRDHEISGLRPAAAPSPVSRFLAVISVLT